MTTKCDAITRIEASALALFSRHGFDGTPLREIALHAGVTLSTIDRYFGSKLDLFNAMHQRVWKEISLEREVLLGQQSAAGNGVLALDTVLYALIYPVVVRAVGDAKQAPVVRLLREFNAMRIHMGLKNAPRPIIGAERWVTLVMAACPGLSRPRAVWALSFVIGTMLSPHLLNGWFDELMPSGGHCNTVAEITRLMVDFCSAGIIAAAAGS